MMGVSGAEDPGVFLKNPAGERHEIGVIFVSLEDLALLIPGKSRRIENHAPKSPFLTMKGGQPLEDIALAEVL